MPRSLLRGAAIGALCAALLAIVFLIDATFLGAEWLLQDAFARTLAARREPDPRVVIVAVTEDATRNLAELNYGRPPYSRELFARAVDELVRAGAAVIAIDITFPDENTADPEGDRKFAEALRRSPVVLAVSTDPRLPRDAGAYASKLWSIGGRRGKLTGVALPFFRDAAGIGAITISTSPHTDVVHRYALLEPLGDRNAVPSLALEAVRMFRGSPRAGGWARRDFAFGKERVPADDAGTFAIRWHRLLEDRRDASRFVSIDKVIMASLAHEDAASGIDPRQLAAFEAQFRGKIVLLGYTAQGLFDLRATPLSARSAGLFIHANAIDNLLNGHFNRDAGRGAVVALILLGAALLGAALNAIRSQIAAGAVALAGVGTWIAAGYRLLAAGLLIPTVTGAASIALTYIVITVVKFTAEQRQSARLRATFGRYVSPQILDYILAHPERVHLGGERRDLTILFSDIRGFTSISEASEPEQVVDMLNEYLTRMVEILLAHGGTLDKFIGDAVMGFWNAPAADPDHPRHAVHCAIEMIEETARLRERWTAEGKPALRIGIGINTGDAVVGNIGAEKVFGYTVIGDAVNLASRLEGKNKDYGTEIIVSEFTLARIAGEFDTVYLDEVKVKGKERAVKIYQVRGPAANP